MLFLEVALNMDGKRYIVTRIEGEYAYLREEGSENSDELFIAMALLPLGVDIGSRLLYVFPDFTLL